MRDVNKLTARVDHFILDRDVLTAVVVGMRTIVFCSAMLFC